MPKTGFGVAVILSNLATGNMLKQPMSCKGWQYAGKPSMEVPGEEASPLSSLEK